MDLSWYQRKVLKALGWSLFRNSRGPTRWNYKLPFVGNFSEILEYNLELPEESDNEMVPNQYVTTIQFTGLSPLYTGTDAEFPGWIFEWDIEGTEEAILQKSFKLEGRGKMYR